MRLNLLNVLCDRARSQSKVKSAFSNVVYCKVTCLLWVTKMWFLLPFLPFEGSDLKYALVYRIGPLLLTLWGRRWVVVCGNFPSERWRAAKRKMGCGQTALSGTQRCVPFNETILFSPQQLLVYFMPSEEGPSFFFLFLSRFRTRTAVSSNFKRWKLSTLVSSHYLFSQCAVVPKYNPSARQTSTVTHFQKETKYILFICEQICTVHSHMQIVSSVGILLMVPYRGLRQISYELFK